MSVFERIATENYGVVGDYLTDLGQNLTLTLAALSYLMPEWPQNAVVTDGDSFDFIVVGSGSAGSVVAGRLSANPDWKVLLVEAGGDPPIESVVPGAVGNLPHSAVDWDYLSVPSPTRYTAHNLPGQVTLTRGKMLGGTSSLNFMQYVRANHLDYDEWARSGLEGWNYDDVLPYFKKSEGNLERYLFEDPELKPYHNDKGPLLVSQPIWSDYINEKNDNIFEFYREIGLGSTKDYNGPHQLGISESFYSHSQPPNAIRYSSARAFLVPVANRSNLHVLKMAYATRVIIKNNKATGIEISVDNKTITLNANKEVIVSCGSYNSPKLLVASGIGAANELAELNIDVVSDLPVGHDMKDHIATPIFFTGKSDIETNIKSRQIEPNINSLPFLFVNGFESISGDERPEFQYFTLYFGAASPQLLSFCLTYVDAREEICKAIIETNLVHEMYVIYVVLLRSKSSGQVKIPSVAPDVDPDIYVEFMAEEEDIATYQLGFQKILSVVNSTYFKEAGGFIADIGIQECGKLNVSSEEYWRCYVNALMVPLYHPIGTNAMGKVVDERLRVYNVERLRVVDASVIPMPLTGNPSVTTMMIAERASDLIKEDNAPLGYIYNRVGQCSLN